jgi:hypothetical protein
MSSISFGAHVVHTLPDSIGSPHAGTVAHTTSLVLVAGTLTVVPGGHVLTGVQLAALVLLLN